MNLSEPTKATLYRLRRIAGYLILIPPDQFALIGKDEKFSRVPGGIRRLHAGLIVRGALLNTVEKEVGFASFQFVADQMRAGEPVSVSDTEVVFSGGHLKAVPERELVALREAPTSREANHAVRKSIEMLYSLKTEV
jgi:hypothetical protein